MAVEVSRRNGPDDGQTMPPPDISRSQDDHLQLDLAHYVGVNLLVVRHSDSVGGLLGNEAGNGKLIIYTPRG